MKDIFFAARGIHYEFNDFDHARPTLVFVHGLSGSASSWKPYTERLEGRYNILLVDLRGHGRSEKFKRYRDYNLKELADDIHELVQHLKIGPFTLVSHSFGTLVALEYLMHYQHSVRSAVFMSPNFGVHGTLRARVSWPILAGLVRIVDILPSRTGRGHRLDYEKYKKTGDWNVRRMAADITATSPRTYLYCLEHSYKFNRDSWWGRITVPTLIIHGKKDAVIPVANAERMARAIQGSELVLLDEADHMLVLNDAEKTVPFIEDFVTPHHE